MLFRSRRLRALGLAPDLAAEPPTTAGIISTLSRENLTGRKVAIQLYPDNPNAELLDFLRAAGASSDPVLCYVYGSEAVDRCVIHVIEEMAAGRVDLLPGLLEHAGHRILGEPVDLEVRAEAAQFVRNRWPPVRIIVTSGKRLIEVTDMPDGSLFFSKPYGLEALAVSMREITAG